MGKKQKELIHVREKVLANGNISLYLDIYFNGKRKYEFLKLYLIANPKTAGDKEKNRSTLQLAQAIKAKKLVQIQNNEYGFASPTKTKTNFLEYFSSLSELRKEEKGNYGNWESALKHLKEYCKDDTTFDDINTEFVEGFKNYLRVTKTKSHKLLSQNTQHSYYNKLATCLRHAHDKGILIVNPTSSVKAPKPGDPERDYLSFEEVKAMAKAECRYPVMKRAFLFSCLTGIRWSDINKMTWSQVQDLNGIPRIVFRQKKTQGQEYLDINEQALVYLGERSKPEDRVFEGLKYSAWHNMELQKWCIRAGITKEITFHCGRHTFAVMMLDLGADLFTTSKLLGHRHIKTTQIYAKVLDKKKQEAVNRIPDLGI
ncbi:Site-specific recombinase XerD [Dyadobacter koreensis]|uniref:Site-specific recombinase XerD n=1 Tax=Dyadobacter koreensis TaxID=408657 RepID=A0A1H6YSN7_9BACT|nr:site-specific integrase [Dyadobacter koreensis]SEJ41957.1 Site-specific recombinase XerD [Dyadobacter koreensis]